MSWSIWLVPSSVWVGAVWSKHGLKWLQECAFTCWRPISPLWFLCSSAIGCKWGKLAPFIFYFYRSRLLISIIIIIFFTGMNWKLHSRLHGQIHLATQFTNGVKWHFQNFPLEAGFLWSNKKINETPLPFPAETTELEVRELSQAKFWDISLHPTSVVSFSQISWP